eukprot:TRINITY_DN12688_c0_g1_i1.p1 TRINITY_DN12688_c0_g1~~TRINITY_DN12688_c0_g1_i1.p1  ORF type:complete len:296 (+),score=-2.17 TRINITY_DN12688_c0_g1_i1:81-968(+)
MLFIVLLSFVGVLNGYVPLVIWHGMGDSCCNPLSIGRLIDLITDVSPGIYVHSLRFGNNIIEDTTNGFFMEVNKQINLACEMIRNDTNLSNGYNAMGFSQGGQFLRAVAQRCPNPPMKILLSVGGQHQGVYGFPRCNAEKSLICEIIRFLINQDIYSREFQVGLVQAEYWHDSDNEKLYSDKSNFIARINMELESDRKGNDKVNLQKLDLLVFVMFSKDTMVEPKESEWFGFYAPNSKKLLSLNESTIYQEDRLGLKEMDKLGKLRFISCPSDHLQFTDEWFRHNIMPYINGTFV